MSEHEGPHHIVHSRFYARTFGLVTAVAVAYLLFRVLQPFLMQLLWAGLLAAILHPFHRRLSARFNNRPTASSAVISFGGALGIIIPVSILATVFTRQAGELLGKLQVAANQRHIEGLSDVLALPAVQGVLGQLQETAGVHPDQVIEWATSGAQKGIQFLLGAGGNVFVGALGAIGNFLFVVFFLFFFLRDGAKAVSTVAHLIPMPPARRGELFATLSTTAQAVVLGTLLTAAVQGTLVGIGFAMAGLPSAIVFGVLAMICSPIPMIGTALVWVPAAGALFLQGRPGWAVFMLVWGVLVVSMVDNILRPLLISGKSGVPTLLVFAGVLGGLASFGSVGMFIGPLILTLVVALIRYADELARQRETTSLTPIPVSRPSAPVPPPPPPPVVAPPQPSDPAPPPPSVPSPLAGRGTG